MRAERIIALTRDVVSTAVGAVGIGWQLWTGKVDATAMLVCAALLGIPGIFGLAQLRPGSGSTPGTPESPSPPAPASSQPPSS